MIDWNHDGKIDGFDHGMTAFMLDEMNGEKSTGCCGHTVAMFLMAIVLPVLVTVVFIGR